MNPIRRSTRCRGVATIEFALVLPLLMLIALLFVFFTKGMLSKQNVLLTDRQFAWRQAKQLPAPDAIDVDINSTYFRGAAVTHSISGGWDGTRQPEGDLVEAALTRSQESGAYADSVINFQCPGNVSQQVRMEFSENAAPLSQFARAISDRYYREGISWQRKDVSVWTTMRDRFVAEFDARMVDAALPAGYPNSAVDRSLAARIRELYLKKW